jgi:uncharacterized protein YndB with AHSA1/START domain
MTDRAKTTIRVSRRYPQSTERVFDAWLDPAIAGKFLFATPAGQIVRAETDPRVGGAFCFVDRRMAMISRITGRIWRSTGLDGWSSILPCRRCRT